MVKRKWLWGKRSSEKIGGEIESSGSMSSNSDKLSEDQETLKGSLSNSLSREVNSKATESEINSEETNKMEQNLVQKLSDAPEIAGTMDSLSNGNAHNISVNVDSQQLSNVSMEDDSKDIFLNENASTISVEDTQDVQVAPQAKDSYEEDNESLKLLTEKLSAALASVSLKEDLVKQHSKVAEEAVAGWEKAEKEATTLKQQLEDAVNKKASLEARVSQLDEALKECVRQLRLARDDQERKINQAVTEKTNELETAKSRLEDQLAELQALVENSRMNSPDLELQHRIEYLENENVLFREELQSLSEELEVRTIERDLSTNAAETASKQHLESIKKVARLEAECRKLKSLSRVSSLSNEHKSSTAAASYVESLTDSHSDGIEQQSASECDSHKINGSWASALIAELDQIKVEKVAEKKPNPSSNINLMDDFLEMERLASLPDSRPQVHSVGCDEHPQKPVHEADNRLGTELESMTHRTAELEENICRVEAEKAELTMTLAQTQSCLEELQVQLIETQMKLEQMDRELHEANEGEKFYKAQVFAIDTEANLMSSQIKSLLAEIEQKQVLSEQKTARCEELENKLKKKDEELEIQRNAIYDGELKMKEMALAQTQDSLEKSESQLKQACMKLEELEKELQEANEEKNSLNIELGSMRAELSVLSSETASLNEQVQKEQNLVAELTTKLQETEYEPQKKIASLNEQVQKEQNLVAELTTKSQETEYELQKKIASLNEQVQKEQDLVAELNTKLQETEYELQRKTLELDVQRRAHSNSDLKIKQEDLVLAAGKLADCQQTIASLGSQLKSLATLEDFLIDPANIPGSSSPSRSMARRSGQPWKLHSNDTYLPEKEYEPLSNIQDDLNPYANHIRMDTRGSPSSSSSSNSSAFFLNYPGSEKNGNGFAHYFPLSRS